MSGAKRGTKSARKSPAKSSSRSSSRSRSAGTKPLAPSPEQGATAGKGGKVQQSSLDGADPTHDTGNAMQLPGAEKGKPVQRSAVPAPTRETSAFNQDDEKSVQKYRDEVHERAEAARAAGTGAEPPRFNPGATP